MKMILDLKPNSLGEQIVTKLASANNMTEAEVVKSLIFEGAKSLGVVQPDFKSQIDRPLYGLATSEN